MKNLLLASFLLITTYSQVYAVEVTVGTGACTGSYIAVCTQLDNEIKKAVDEDLPDASIGDYGTGLANANGFAQKGLGSDYSDIFTFAMVRGGLGVAVDGEMDKPESADGFGFGAAATVGINLDLLPIDKIGPIDLSKMDLFISFLSYDVDQDDKDFSSKGDFSHLSIMARYQIIDSKTIFPGNMLEWGGVFLHTGFQRSSFDANLTTSFNGETVEVSGQEATFQNSSASFDLETKTTSIPIEVSTYIRTLWALTFFTGAGFDIVSGSTDVSLAASGNIVGGDGGANTYSNTISASESDSGDADATNFRAFGGVQLNLPFFRIYAHANKGIGNNLIGVNAGAKFLW